MLKKLTLYISAVIIITYISLWIWAIYWIDKEHNVNDFVSDSKNLTLETAKIIWKITPAIDRKKDAERLLKISELSIYTDLHNLISNLKMNYNLVSSYYQKYEEKLEGLEMFFLLQRLILINRSYGEIKDINFNMTFKNFIDNMVFENLQEQMKWYPEIIWFSFFNKDMDTYKKGWELFENVIKEMNKKNNTIAFNIIGQYHLGLILCYDSDILKTKYADSSNRISKKVFQQIQKQITPTSYQHEILDDYLSNYSSNILITIPLIMSSKTECEKEMMNFLDKIIETENIGNKVTIN